MSFDLKLALRRIKPQRTTSALRRRPVAALPAVRMAGAAGQQLLLDTCVYVDVLQERTPASVDKLIGTRIVNHSTVCLAELTHLFGRLDPAHPNTKQALREIQRTIEDMPEHRLSSPSAAAVGEAGMLAGLVARLSGAGRDKAPSLLNDASLYLQALESGWIILTRNIRDFDYFDQLLPTGGVLFYEQS